MPRSLRARLTASYTLAAVVLTVAGSIVFLVVLQAGLDANLDNDAVSRAATIAAVLQESGRAPEPVPPGVSPPSSSGDRVDTFAAYARPNGTLVSATGARLPAFTLPASFIASARTSTARTSLEINRADFRLVGMPVRLPGGVWLAVVGVSRSANNEALGEVEKGLLFTGLALIVLIAAGTWLLAVAALRPVDRMRRDADELGSRVGRGRLSVPDTDDELAALARTLNELLDRLRRSLARQRELVADAGHELRTPLAVLRTELELADRPGRSRAELAEAVSSAAVEADRLSQLADDLLYLARADEGEPLVRLQATDVTTVVASAVRASRTREATAAVALEVDCPAELPAVVDPSALRRALDNLLSNAFEHTPAGGTVRLCVELAGRTGPMQIRVEDGGPGFPADFLPHAFERFRRADAARRHSTGHNGTGLGLAIVAEVAAAHGGSARAANLPGGGASVELELPYLAGETQPGPRERF